ncbi:class I SAM-dependent methyltransferase [Brucella pituitosa]|uniref:class I SAM-dependent methyltransferase n=1 Tax=Brucella pituitosa TaxID=571256 RepID=UPI000C280F9A|nr:class I SAM-dependent methyltransferase [Brucella pituitosa]PJO48120.1 hypothetical protein CWE02_10400 [Brucella pituitosa]
MEPAHPLLDAVAYYDQLASDLASQYEAVTFINVHPNLSKYLPNRGRVLDIGAGSGRDARGLAAMGFHVTAVEPSAEFRRLGKANNSDRIIWVDDRLPKLAALDGAVDPFDFILCSAVLMLLSPKDLIISFRIMKRLMVSHGYLAINVRDRMPSEPKEIFHSHSQTAICEAAKLAGLTCIDSTEVTDALGRQGYLWRCYIFTH